MLLIGDITFPRWNGDAQFDPYITEKQIDDALNHGKSLDAAVGGRRFLAKDRAFFASLGAVEVNFDVETCV